MLLEFNLLQLCREADLIVQAHVVKANASAEIVHFGPNDSLSLVYTRHELRVEDVLKRPGYSIGERVHVFTLGGSVGDISEEVDCEARLQPEEDVVLFLSKDFPEELPNDGFTVFGGFQGKFRIGDEGGESRIVSGPGMTGTSRLSKLRQVISEQLEEVAGA